MREKNEGHKLELSRGSKDVCPLGLFAGLGRIAANDLRTTTPGDITVAKRKASNELLSYYVNNILGTVKKSGGQSNSKGSWVDGCLGLRSMHYSTCTREGNFTLGKFCLQIF